MARQEYETAVARFDPALRQKLRSAYKAYAFQDRAFSENAKGCRMRFAITPKHCASTRR